MNRFLIIGAALLIQISAAHADRLSSVTAFVSGVEAFRQGNYELARHDFLVAANEGHVEAQFMLGEMYRKKLGVAVSYSKAVHWYEKAAQQGHTAAQVVLGFLYAVAGNEYEKAAYWYRQAAEKGSAHGQRGLGLLYLGGQGVPQNHEEAYFWLLLSAANGDQIAPPYRDQAREQLPNKQALMVQKRAKKWQAIHHK